MENLEHLQNSVLSFDKYAILFALMRDPTKHLIISLEHIKKCGEKELSEGVQILLDNREKEFNDAMIVTI